MILFCCLFIAIIYETYRIFRIRSVSSFSLNPHNSNSSTKSNNRRTSNGTVQTNTNTTTTNTTTTNNTTNTNFHTIRSSFYRFGWYPLNMIICWFTPTVYDIFLALHTGHHHSITEKDTIFTMLSNCTPGLLGLLNVIVFVTTNIHIRDKVLSLLPCKKKNNNRETMEESDKSILMKNDINRESDAYYRQSAINPQHEYYHGSDHTAGDNYNIPFESPNYNGYDDYSIGEGSTGGGGASGGSIGIAGLSGFSGIIGNNWPISTSVGDISHSTNQSDRESNPITSIKSDTTNNF